jgi:phage-related protein
MSEELLYDRSNNISGVALIGDNKYTPAYGSSITFFSENAKFNTNDNYYQSLPNGINNVKAKFNLIYKVNEVGARELANYYENSEGVNSVPIITDPSIYRKTFGYCTDYSISHINNQNYEFKATLDVVEASCVLNWKSNAFLNYDSTEWKWDKDYKKNDIVYIEQNDLKINNFFYCTKDHKSSALNSPIGEDTAWTQDFFWEPDLNTNTQVKIDAERFENSSFTAFSKVRKNTATFPVSYSFSNISDKQLRSMLHFLENKSGYRRFKHQIPSVYNRPKVFVCPSWSHTFLYNNNHNLTVSFEEDPLGIIPKKSTYDSTVDLSVLTTVYDQNGDVLVIDGKDNPLEGGIDDSYYTTNTGIHSIKIGNSASYIGYRAFSDCPTISGELKIPNTVEGIAEFAFGGFLNSDSGCRFTGSLEIPDSVSYLYKKAFRGVPFDGDLKLGSNIESIGDNCFRDCGFTGSLKIPNKTTTIWNAAFDRCSGFNGSLDLGSGLETINGGVFRNCQNFTGDLLIPDSIRTIGDASFSNCFSFSSLQIGKNVEYIGELAFDKCSGFFGDLILPDSLTGLGRNSFMDCENFDGQLVLSNYLSVIDIGTFARCTNITGELIIPTGISEINTNAFLACENLGSIVSSGSLNSIGDFCFKNTTGLQEFYINSDSSVFQGADAFSNTNSGLNIYAKQPHLSSYDSAWSGAQGLPNGVTIQEWIQ